MLANAAYSNIGIGESGGKVVALYIIIVNHGTVTRLAVDPLTEAAVRAARYGQGRRPKRLARSTNAASKAEGAPGEPNPWLFDREKEDDQ